MNDEKKVSLKAPETETELLQRAQALAGKTLASIAQTYQSRIPPNLRQEKGWVGQLLEIALGATAGAKAKPDFELIDVELKTIPLNNKHLPKESTFVCTVPQRPALTWHESHVWQKLKRVLWLPVEADNTISLARRRIGSPILWSPNPQQETILEQDWHELCEMLTVGQYDQLTAKHGTYLHCRPKAAHSRILRKDINQQGETQLIVPRGFYLRTSFTTEILQSLL